MPGSVTNNQRALPVQAGTPVPAASTSGTGDAGLDGTTAPYVFVLDANNPGAKVPLATLAQEGTDAAGSNAGAQAGSTTLGVGIRGWLSTLAGLLQLGKAKVTLVDGSQAAITSINPLSVGGAVTVNNSGAAPVPVSGTLGVTSSAGSPIYTNPRLLTTQDTVSIGPQSTSGATAWAYSNAGTFALQTIKASAGTLYALEATNTSGATAYLAVYDAASPTPGTTAPKMVYAVPAGGTTGLPLGLPGRAFASAITVFCATAASGAVGSAAGVYLSAAYY